MAGARSRLLVVIGCSLVVLGGCQKGEEIPGDPASFDPVESFAAVQSYAGSDFRLTSITVTSMRLDGTLDLTTTDYKPTASYHFEAPAAAPKDAPPPGASGSSRDGRWKSQVSVSLYRKGTRWHITQIGGNVNREYTLVTRGMLATEPDISPGAPEPALPAPRCTFGALWKQVDRSELPAGAVVDGRYHAEGYELRDTIHSKTYEFDFDCQPRSR